MEPEQQADDDTPRTAELVGFRPDCQQITRPEPNEHTLDVNPWLAPSIAELVSRGLPFTHAVTRFGVLPRTAQKWLSRGMESDDPSHPETRFYLLVACAHSHYVEKRLAEIDDKSGPRSKGDSPGDWKAAMALLERQDPAHFARQSVNRVGTPNDRTPFALIDPANQQQD